MQTYCQCQFRRLGAYAATEWGGTLHLRVESGPPGQRVDDAVPDAGRALGDAAWEVEDEKEPSGRRRRQADVVEVDERGDPDDVEAPQQWTDKYAEATNHRDRSRVDTGVDRVGTGGLAGEQVAVDGAAQA